MIFCYVALFIMNYKAKVKTNRNGAKLILYVKIIFFWFPIEMYGRYINENVWFVIDDDLKKWKKYYDDRLTIVDTR